MGRLSDTCDTSGEGCFCQPYVWSSIFTPVHDIDPTVANTDEIGYEVLGTYPNRVLVETSEAIKQADIIVFLVSHSDFKDLKYIII